MKRNGPLIKKDEPGLPGAYKAARQVRGMGERVLTGTRNRAEPGPIENTIFRRVRYARGNRSTTSTGNS